MYYAIGDTIGNGAAPDGAIEITREQWKAALEAKMDEAREALVVEGALVIRDRAPSDEHTWQGGEWVAPPEPGPEPPTLEDFIVAVEGHLNAVARSPDPVFGLPRFGSAQSAAVYVNSPRSEWAEWAQTFVAYRDDVWTYAYTAFAEVAAGERRAPESVEAFIAELPVIEWPQDAIRAGDEINPTDDALWP